MNIHDVRVYVHQVQEPEKEKAVKCLNCPCYCQLNEHTGELEHFDLSHTSGRFNNCSCYRPEAPIKIKPTELEVYKARYLV